VDDRIARLELVVDQLREEIRVIQGRLDALVQGGGAQASRAAAPAADAEQQVQQPRRASRLAGRDPYDPVVVLTYIGRLFLVLAGGFFLRAMTESGLLVPAVGVSLAFLYGLSWLVLADRAGARQQVPNAAFHAVGSALVVFPLLVEATTRFKVLGPAGSVLLILVLTAAFLFVAWHRRLQAVAWVAVAVALPTSLALLLKTGAMAPYALYLIAFGVATLWLCYALGWRALRWPTALVADLAVAGLAVRAMTPGHAGTAAVAVLLQWTLLGAYLGSIAFQSLARGRNVGVFEVVQTALALLIGFAATIVLDRAIGSVPVAVGVMSLVLGAASYAVAFTIIGKRDGQDWNLYYYTSLALVLVLAGSMLCLRSPWPALLFAALAVVAAAAWSRLGRRYMLLHAAVYAAAAAVVSGALGYGAAALGTDPDGPWEWPSVPMLVVLVASAASAVLVAKRPAPAGGGFASSLRLIIAVVLVWVTISCLTGFLAPVVARAADGGVDPGVLATLRTAVLAAASLLIAWLGRRAEFREWAWIVYPVLVGTGLKMVVQDFNDSRPATLFIALALFGAALILAPRLKRARKAGQARAEAA
jgi:hypothetical protein